MEGMYIQKFIELVIGKVEYENRLSVIKHNRKAKKLIEMYNELEKNKEVAKKVYKELIKNDNEEVKVIAASHCLKLEIYIKESEEILKECISSSKNPILQGEADIVLQLYSK